MKIVRVPSYHGGAGAITAISPEAVAAVVDAYHAPGGFYDPHCTVYLLGGEKVTIALSADDFLKRIEEEQ